MSPSDDTLLAGMAAGDADAAAAFVRRFQRRVYGLAFTVVRDHAAAEDVSQEAFVRAWRNAASYDSRRGAVLTWLLAITRNAAIDVVRVRRPDVMDPETLALRLQDEAADRREGGYEEVDHIRRALAGLAPEQRRALVLATYFGRTAREVSELEHIPVGTAKSRIRTALLRLRESMEFADGN